MCQISFLMELYLSLVIKRDLRNTNTYTHMNFKVYDPKNSYCFVGFKILRKVNF